MVWLNTIHRNETAPPGTFGGAMCTCEECQKKRKKPPEKTAIEIMQEDMLPKEKAEK